MKLHGIYTVVSNKTIRAKEKFYKRYRKKNKKTPGQLVKTNRGFFIDGHQVDIKSAELWFNINNEKMVNHSSDNHTN